MDNSLSVLPVARDMIAQWDSSLSVLPVARVQFSATTEYFKGFLTGWSHSANPTWASVAANGSLPSMTPHMQPMDSEEESRNPNTDRRAGDGPHQWHCMQLPRKGIKRLYFFQCYKCFLEIRIFGIIRRVIQTMGTRIIQLVKTNLQSTDRRFEPHCQRVVFPEWAFSYPLTPNC